MKLQRQILVGHPNLILDTLRELCDERGWYMGSNPKNFNNDSEWRNVSIVIGEPKVFRAQFELQQMPGCCAVLVIHHVGTNPWTEKRFDLTLQAIEAAAYEAGFGSVLMAQVVRLDNNNKPMIDREPWGPCVGRWQMSEPFVNAKSGNSVVYLSRSLEQPGKRAGLEVQIPQ